ncbi:hypothetical protein M422DRAFT_52780 [Sphaerobolus stellatus SS14]|uniref:Ubiquitin-like protease family profile domain-containing protein n=1 Tax=Sphaerobolus stellatus (strain SS14) TaxID=990650 RepID=A0A0C9V5F7_SPHS4|nr:hypothetical protein M422DRAFT_52780 [Sphaerobolus stellatus SS14]
MAEDCVETSTSLDEDILSAQLSLESTTKALHAAEKSLGLSGAEAKSRLRSLKGSEFLRYRMNAKALKSQIRAKVIARRFERGHLEKAYRHHVTKEKDHAQTKALLKRDLKQRKKSPLRARIPPKLKMKKMFRLDVDDDIWNNDGLQDEDDNCEPPGWLANEDIRKGITALLNRARAEEELERIKAEEDNAMFWLRSEVMRVQTAILETQGEPALFFQMEMRLKDLWNLSEHWQAHIDRAGKRKYLWMTAGDFPGGLAQPKVRVSEPAPDAASVSSSEASQEVDDPPEEEDTLGELCEHFEVAGIGSEGGEGEESSSSSDDEESPLETKKIGMVDEYLVEADGRFDPSDISHHSLPKDDSLSQPVHDMSPTIGGINNAPFKLERRVSQKQSGQVLAVESHSAMASSWPVRATSGVPAVASQQVACRPKSKQKPFDHNELGKVLDQPEKDHTIMIAWIRKEFALVKAMTPKRFWLLPAHVPSHWTLIVVDWPGKLLQLLDSLPNRLGADADELPCEDFVLEEWRWEREQRPQRQNNSYDCGAFLLADMASYIGQGEQSAMTQSDMKNWRSEILSILDGLPGLDYLKVVPDPDQEPLLIDD